jgi:predicted DNA binding CopG/RHH family protein
MSAEEREVLDAYERGELRSEATTDRLAQLRQAAHVTTTKDRRVNIRLSSADLNGLQTMALRAGLPYQSLMSSVLHRYVTGQLVEPRSTS